MDFTEKNRLLKELREKNNQIQFEFGSTRNQVEKEVTEVFFISWNNKFPKNPCYANASVNSDRAEVKLYNVSYYNAEKGWSEKVAFIDSENGWAIQDPKDDFGYGLCVPGPFPFHELVEKISEIENEHPGLTISLVKLKLRNEVKEIRSFKAIQMLHKNSVVEFLSKGEKRYKGWDISDKYIRVLIDGVKWVWWSSDGHGGPLLNSAKEGTPEYSKFENWLSSDN